jgi:hypothetical protein
MTKVIIRGNSGQPLGHYFTWPLACSWGDLFFCHSFFIVPKTAMSLLGQDLLSQIKAQILLPQAAISVAPSLETNRYHNEN